jgi:NAD(P)-dependent dehydrogenase (short-subunit alcohol dehydrogenase family)
MSIKDKIAVVTGGSRGLGFGLVEALIPHGAGVTSSLVAPKRSSPSAPGWASLQSPQMLRTKQQPTASSPSSAQTSWR